MADAIRDAKLRLNLDTAQAVRGMDDVVRAGEKVEQQLKDTEKAAEKTSAAIAKGGDGASAAATNVIGRFGAGDLSKSELRKARAEAKRLERAEQSEIAKQIADERRAREESRSAMDAARKKRSAEEARVNKETADKAKAWESLHDDAQKRVDEYRLGSHYKRKREESAKSKSWEDTHDDAMKRVEEYRLNKHYRTQRESVSQKKEYEKFQEEFATEQAVLERQAQKKAAEDRIKRIRDSELERKRHEDQVALAQKEAYANRLRGITATASVLGGGNPLAVLGGFGMAGGAAAAGITAAGHLASAGSQAYVNANNPDRGFSRSVLDFRNSVSFGAYGWGRDIYRGVSGLSNADQRRDIARQEGIVGQDADARVYAMNQSAMSESVRAHTMSHFSQGAIARPGARFDQTSFRGMESHLEEQARIPAVDAAEQARREQQAIEGARGHEHRQLGVATERHAARLAARDQAEAAARDARNNENTTPEQHMHALRDLQSATAAETAAQRELQQQIQRTRDADIAGVNATMNVRQRNIELMRTELSIEQGRLQRHLSAAGRIGNLNPIDRQMGLAAARAVRDRGFQNVTPEVRQRAQQFAPEWFEQRAQQFGEGAAEFQAGRREGLLSAAGNDTAAQMRENIQRMQDGVRQTTLDATAEVTRGMATIFRDLTDALLRVTAAERDRAIAELTAGRQIQQGSQ